MEFSSEFINRITESETLAAARIARELKAEGKDVIALNLGEPDFNTPDFIKDAAINAINNNYSKYPPVNGYLEVREAICKKFKRDNDLDFTPDQIVVSTGAKQSLVNVILSLVGKGDDVVLFSPYWVSYRAMVDLSGANTIEVKANIENDFKVTPAQLEKAITPNTKLIVFSSPCNPTGTVFSSYELEALAAVIKKHPDLIVISDEIYEHINFEGKHASIGAFAGIKNQVVTVNGVSKSFAMTGYRIGYIGAPLWIAKLASKMQGQSTSGANGIAQMAAKAAVEADPAEVKYMQDAFEKRRTIVLRHLNEIPGIKANKPKGAFYFFPDVSELFGKKTPDGNTIKTASDFCDFLLKETFVSVVSGAAFGAPNCFRISYATSEQLLNEAFKRIKAAVALLKD